MTGSRRGLLIVLLLGLISVGCTADPSTIEPETASAPTTAVGAQGDDSEAGQTSPTEDTTDDEDDASEQVGFSVLGALALIPAAAAEDAESSLQVSVADVDAAADQARLRRPADPRDPEQVFDFITPLTGFSRNGRIGRIFVPFPRLLTDGAIQGLDEFIDEIGFSPSDVTTFAALESPPAQFIVVGGVNAPAGLPEVAAGVSTIGEGEDFALGIEGRTPARPLGRPIRVAERDGLVAFSLATPPLAQWAGDVPLLTLADDQRLGAVAARLDEERVVSAALFTQDGFPYESVGLGWSADDNGPQGVIVFHYPGASAAEEQLPLMTAAFEGESLTAQLPLSDLIEMRSIETRDSDIVVVVTFPSDRDPITLFELFIRQDVPFALPG